MYKLISISFLLLLSSCSYLNQKFGFPDDNVIEESVEAILKDRTGIDIDLTPSSPEE